MARNTDPLALFDGPWANGIAPYLRLQGLKRESQAASIFHLPDVGLKLHHERRNPSDK